MCGAKSIVQRKHTSIEPDLKPAFLGKGGYHTNVSPLSFTKTATLESARSACNGTISITSMLQKLLDTGGVEVKVARIIKAT